MTLCMPGEGRWLRAMPATVGTATLDWVLSMVGATHAEVEELLRKPELTGALRVGPESAGAAFNGGAGFFLWPGRAGCSAIACRDGGTPSAPHDAFKSGL